MPALTSGEARRLIGWARPRPALTIFALVAVLGACAAPDLHARAVRDDAARGTSIFTWTYDHDPARLDVWNLPDAAVAPYLRDGHARRLDGTVDIACGIATREHALLLVVAPEHSTARTRALDCGFAIERDRFAVVIAPR